MHEEEKKAINQTQSAFAAMSCILENNLPAHLASDARAHLQTIYGCAVAHALRDLEIISTEGSFNEEDRTSSLIGHLGSHLSWYLAMADLSGLDCEQPSVCWSYQSKKAEAEKGGDFGLAVRLSADKYNIAFFQAKNADLEASVNLWRPPHGYKPPTKKMTQQQAAEATIACKPIDNELFKAIHGQQLSVLSGTGQHQFVKLALLADTARKKIRSKSNWIHYVIWPENRLKAPIVFDLPTLQTILQQPGAVSKASLNVSAVKCEKAGKFAALLMRGNKTGSDGWLELSSEQAKDLIGDLTELCNRWVIVEDRESSRGLANVLKNQDTTVIAQQPPLTGIPQLQIQMPLIKSSNRLGL